MDPAVTSIATGVMAVLMPYVTKGAEEFARLAGEAAYHKAKGLLEALRSRWTGDQEATRSLENFEQKPERYKPVLEDILQGKLAQDKTLAADLDRRLQEMGPVLEIIQSIKDAEGVTGLEAREMTAGKARITQTVDKGKNVTGAKIDRLG